MQKKKETLNPNNEFGPQQLGNKDAKDAADKAKAALEKMTQYVPWKKVSELPDRKSKLHYVADMIEQQALVMKGIGFNMGTYVGTSGTHREDRMGKSCGTIACIAGWASLLEYGDEKKRVLSDNAHNIARNLNIARKLLELSDDEADQLFLGEGEYGYVVMLDKVTPETAVAVIRDFADNGKVRWAEFATEDEKYDWYEE